MKYGPLTIILIIVLFSSCKNDDGPKGFPGVITSLDPTITEDGVTVSAKIQNEDFLEIIDHGFVYSLEKTIENEDQYNRISLGSFSGTGQFSFTIDRNLKTGINYVVKAFIKTKDRLVYGNPITFISKGSKSPVLESFYPQTAYIGDTLTITGQYFSDKNMDNTIYFGKIIAYPLSSSNKMLKVIVPQLSGSTCTKLKIIVAGKTIESNNKFLLGIPVIYRFKPEKALPLETIEIKGKGLTFVHEIIIDERRLELMQLTDSTANFALPSYIQKGMKTIQLSQLDRIVSTEKQLEVLFPEILSVSPLKAWLDTVIYIKGTHLDKLDNLNINYQPLSTLFKSDSLLKVKVSSVFKSGNIRANFLYNNILSNQMVTFNPPVITSVSPSTAKYGELVHVYGDRFFPGLSFSGWSSTYLSKNEVTLDVPWTVPAGFFSFKLKKEEEYPESSVGLTILPIEIEEITPYEVKRGAEITIKVRNLPDTEYSYESAIRLDNNSSLTITEMKDGIIKAIVPIYLNCSQNPTLSLSVGSQTKSLENAIHINDKWEKISINSNLSPFSLFCYSEENETAYNYDLQNSSLKTFSPQLQQWTDLSRSPFSDIPYTGTSFQLGSDLFFVGVTSDNFMVGYRYSIPNQTWLKLANYPEKLGSNEKPFAFVINGVAYVGTISKLFQYDEVSNTWLKKSSPLSKSRREIPLSFSINDKGYLLFQLGVIGNTLPVSYFAEFNPKTNTWLKVGEINWGLYDGGDATEFNNKVYLSANSYLSTWQNDDNFLEFDPLTYQFKKLMPPPEYFYPRTYSFISGDYFYVVSVGDNYYSWMYRIRLSDLTSL